MAKKELDKLSLDMIECEKAGYGCHYGAWKAAQGETVEKPEEIKEKPVPQGWRTCKYCGKPFKPKTQRKQVYCEYECQQAAARERDNAKHKEYYRAYMERKRAKQKGDEHG